MLDAFFDNLLQVVGIAFVVIYLAVTIILTWAQVQRGRTVAVSPPDRDEQVLVERIERLREKIGAIRSDPRTSLELSALFAPSPGSDVARFWAKWFALTQINPSDPRARALLFDTEIAFDLAKAEARETGLGLEPSYVNDRDLDRVKTGLHPQAHPDEVRRGLVAAARLLSERRS